MPKRYRPQMMVGETGAVKTVRGRGSVGGGPGSRRGRSSPSWPSSVGPPDLMDGRLREASRSLDLRSTAPPTCLGSPPWPPRRPSGRPRLASVPGRPPRQATPSRPGMWSPLPRGCSRSPRCPVDRPCERPRVALVVGRPRPRATPSSPHGRSTAPVSDPGSSWCPVRPSQPWPASHTLRCMVTLIPAARGGTRLPRPSALTSHPQTALLCERASTSERPLP